MFNEKLVKTGDILLYKPSKKDWLGKTIAWFSAGGKYSHASIYIGNGKIIESHIESGVIEKELNSKWYSIIDVYRPRNTLGFNKTELLISNLRKKINSDYDLKSFAPAFWYSVIGKLPFLSKHRLSKPKTNDPNKFYCSELITTAYHETGINICSQVHYMNASPSDLGRSKDLYLVC